MPKVLLVDDEPLARDELRSLLASWPEFEIAGECGNAIEAMAQINRLHPDVVFLDIQMPRISGLELLAMLDPEHTPQIVFVTAFDEYAIRAFEEHAFDYLLKPLDPSRLAKTVTRLLRQTAPASLAPLQALAPLTMLPCHGVNRIVLLRLDEVEYASARASGVFVIDATGHEHFTELTLRTLEARSTLFRCHRQHLVNLAHIREIRLGENGLADILTTGGHTLAVSRRYLKPLKEALGIDG